VTHPRDCGILVEIDINYDPVEVVRLNLDHEISAIDE
jgi:hypothetical protein